ncbi:YjfB family protein [Syntrophomonas palmitatica]|uniref:YjfB family protein n=1 Tax=Syntrophomonas palmitatica TaxID=402877 RepID=UPI0006CF6084|nr:YjfB family protein [Syntrophomonas palmitatica]
MDSVDIAGMAMSMKSVQLQQQVSMAVMKMQMDASQESAQNLIAMMQGSSRGTMEKSVAPHLGANIDILA